MKQRLMNTDLLPKEIRWCLKEKAQAVTELAVLGALIIVAFSFLINYSEKLNRQQANIQQTFRAALKEAGKANNSAAYTKRVFLRMPNVSSPKELGQLESFGDSANVLWMDGRNRDDVYAYDNINNQYYLVARYPRPGVEKYQFDDQIVDVPKAENEYDEYGNLKFVPPKEKNTEIKESFTNYVDATTTLTRQESSGSVTTQKNLTASDKLVAEVVVDGEQQAFTHYLGEGGKYSSGGKSMSR
ncbi:MAG: hypothetical protein PHO40_06195 [Candidatus Omnitrophica bacterium]|nr:hypothetical protein [Candidatus Omnitrophota bacterium]